MYHNLKVIPQVPVFTLIFLLSCNNDSNTDLEKFAIERLNEFSRIDTIWSDAGVRSVGVDPS